MPAIHLLISALCEWLICIFVFAYLSYLYFSFLLFYASYLLFYFFFYLLPSRILDPLRFQAGGRRRQLNLGLVCFVLMFAVFLANVNSRSRSLYAIARPSVCLSSVCLSVCNARAPYSGGLNFRQYFYGIRYLGHPWTSTENFTEIVPGEPLRRGS